ncbi:ribbon-helix-helix protein, CopG family [Nocardioides sp.]|uniref:ribbon-helix-helix protein, CopG family n=1 Tax=Nocardioides sp. TaxID=35761 RepID=UPI003783215E
MPGRGTPRRTFRIPDELWEAAQREAEDRDEDLSDVVRRMLRQYVDHDDPK